MCHRDVSSAMWRVLTLVTRAALATGLRKLAPLFAARSATEHLVRALVKKCQAVIGFALNVCDGTCNGWIIERSRVESGVRCAAEAEVDRISTHRFELLQRCTNVGECAIPYSARVRTVTIVYSLGMVFWCLLMVNSINVCVQLDHSLQTRLDCVNKQRLHRF